MVEFAHSGRKVSVVFEILRQRRPVEAYSGLAMKFYEFVVSGRLLDGAQTACWQ